MITWVMCKNRVVFDAETKESVKKYYGCQLAQIYISKFGDFKLCFFLHWGYVKFFENKHTFESNKKNC